MDRFDWLEIKGAEAEKAQEAQADDSFGHDSQGYYRRARKMREAGHFRLAVQYYQQATGLDSHHYIAWRELIDTLVRARQLKRADEVSSKALQLHPNVVELYAARGLVLLHMQQMDSAKAHVERGHANGDRSWYLSCVQAEIILLDNKGYAKEVSDCMTAAFEASNHSWEPYFIGGWFMLDAELPTWAAGYLAEAGHRNPTAPIVWLCLGDCFRDLRLFDQAMFYYQKATELEPEHQLALKRQRACAPSIFGMMRIFSKESLLERWNRAVKDGK